MKPTRACALLVLFATGAFAAEKSEVTTRSFSAKEGKSVLVDAGPLDLQVRAADINEIRLKIELVAAAFSENQAKNWIEQHRPTVEDGEEQLKITAPDPSGISLFKGVLVTRARIELVLPLSVRPDLSTGSGSLRAEGEFATGKPLRLRTASGDAEFVGWAPEIEARSTSGDIVLRATRALGNLMARTASGSVQLTGGARVVRCDTSSGDVRLDGLLGAANVASTSGSVALHFDALAPADEVHVTTTSGKVRVSLPPGSEPGGEIGTSKGEIRSAFPGESDPNSGKLKLTGVGPKLFVTTTSGRVDLD